MVSFTCEGCSPKSQRRVTDLLPEISLDIQMESSLGILDYDAVTDATTSIATQIKKRSSYQKWTASERFEIGKYGAQNGNFNAVRKFSRNEKPLNESSVRRFVKLYKNELKKASKEKRDVENQLIPIQRGRKLMLGSLDQKVQNYLRSYRSRGGPISTIVAVTVAKVLISRNPELELQHIDLDSSSWAKSLFKRMGFVRRMKTTGKPEIPPGAKKEAELLYLHDIVAYIEEYNISPNLVMNLDQTPLKYVPVSHHTLAKKGEKSVAITGSSDKRSITGTFTITLDGKFLPLQLIYGGKTKQSLPRFKFPDSFTLSTNLKHFSNTEESIKIINEVILPYVNDERERIGEPNQPALLILDVFRGQMTKDVTDLLLKNKIFYVKVPNNMTQLFQPLDLTVNGHCKSFLKRKFAEWLSRQFNNQLSIGKKVEDIEMKFPLTTIKPIHASWITDFYNHMSTEEGMKIIENGWKASGIFGAVQGGSVGLAPIDPFQDISPLPIIPPQSIANLEIPGSDVLNDFVNVVENDEDDEESEWEDGEDDIEFARNAFDFIIDDEVN